MQVKFHTFPVGAGDCITLLLKNGDKELHIMVDCGHYKPEVNDYIKNEFHGHIDYLIVTHIDNDHIVGLISMLTKKKKLKIRHILYNCYQRISDNAINLDEKMKENIKRVIGNLPVIVDMLEYKISEEKAKILAEVILANEQWNKAWQKEYITNKSKQIELSNDMGKLIFLSPSTKALEAIDHLYRKLFWEKMFKQKKNDYKEEETIYEALLRSIPNQSDDIEEKICSTELSEEALKILANTPLNPITPTNMASIAFIWEKEEHRILFMGDATPEQVCISLNNIYSDIPKPILFDVIKVSHHGSAENTSNELITIADSKQFFITGKTNASPSINTLARIITAPLSDKISSRTINYNRESPAIKELITRQDLKNELKFTILNNTKYEFFC